MRDLTIELENRPGALAEMGEALGGAGVSVSDHDHQLILVVDDTARGRKVSETWSRER